ncbi:MAG TPA: site-2 protease family protein [Oscillatoriaceae cyanobacterium M33_DOE_052]|uniref:Zinc metalloprotease n=1 Tax=Planktothricoides sp. SpSt-374 TaxID=2282167 RepID=A0A7C3ZMG3_9CYAN|nr:site-2 protease family protein [Oscillatoriaceae cyanobacterium M33_DOE_052]
MQAGWRIGTLFGIPFYINSSWLIILVLFTAIQGEAFAVEWGKPLLGWTAGLVMTLLLFACVLLHELGHSLTAQSQGIRVNSITLFVFGGVAAMERESKTPEEAFQVAIAGPVVSFALFAVLAGLTYILPAQTPVWVVANELSRINLVLAMFNLIPGLPLDGGQVLKAAVWKITNNRLTGIRAAAKTGKILGFVAVSSGLYLFFVANNSGLLWVALLGWFCLRNAQAYDRLTDLQEAMMQIKASDTMSRAFRVVDAQMTLRRFADEYLLELPPSQIYFAAANGRYSGLVVNDDIRYIERSQWELQAVNRIVRSLEELVAVEETAPLWQAAERLEVHNLTWLTVLSHAGTVAGVIDRGDIVGAVADKLNITIPPAEMKRIKQEGTYPPGFHLGLVAKAIADES